MKKDINKNNFLANWLSGNLTDEEQETFEKSDDYLAYKDILMGVEQLDRPVFDVEQGLENQKIYNASFKKNKIQNVIKLRTWLYSAAAVVLIVFGLKTLYFQDIVIQTQMAETRVVTLPDYSVVTLNADSFLKYDKDAFMEHRALQLKGEAFFDVQKGSAFTVNTKNGKVTVLGTEFDVYSRDKQLEVHCFEGKVSVANTSNEVILTQGKAVKSNKNKSLSMFDITNLKPDWLHGKSSFNAVPISQLIKELEIQYDIKIKIGNVDVNRLFTGFFVHNNLEAAMRSSFDPMNINYTFEQEKIIALKNK